MSSTYSRVAEVNEKIRSVQLTITQWRVLFAINESTSLSEITEYVEADESAIKESLTSLGSLGLISSENGEITEDATEAVIAEETVEEVIEDTVEDVLEPEVVEEVVDVIEEEVEAIVEDETIAAEPEVTEEVVIEDEVIEPVIEEPEENVDASINEDEGFEVVEEVAEEVAETTEPEKEESTDKAEADSSGDIGGKKIMIVDDSIVIRKMVELAFEDKGMTITGYASAKDALDAFDSDSPDIAIIEPALPDTKGEDLVKALKEKKNIPVVMFSGKNASMEIDGVDDFVQKPFKDDDLVSKVQALIA